MKIIDQSGKRLKVGLNVAVLLVALFSFLQKDKVVDKTSFFENIMIDSFSPIQGGVALIWRKLVVFKDDYWSNLNAGKENILLRRKVADLERRLFEGREVAHENMRLKKLLGFVERISSQKILAQVVAWDSNSDFKVLRINKGVKDGVRLQSAVITDKGVVGYIYRMTDHFSDVLTILDSSNKVDGIIERIRSRGIVEGYSYDKCMMKYVTRTDPIVLRDVVITSGLGNIYPKGIKIGEVSRIERESYGITQYIEIKPMVDFQRLEEVVILIPSDDGNRTRELKVLDGKESLQ